jgi:hypothetical protein
LKAAVTHNRLNARNRPGVDEVAALSVHAATTVEEDPTLFGLVFGVELLILAEFLGAMGELALLLVRTEPLLHELLAQLRFFLILPYGRFALAMGGRTAGRTGIFSREGTVGLLTR